MELNFSLWFCCLVIWQYQIGVLIFKGNLIWVLSNTEFCILITFMRYVDSLNFTYVSQLFIFCDCWFLRLFGLKMTDDLKSLRY